MAVLHAGIKRPHQEVLEDGIVEHTSASRRSSAENSRYGHLTRQQSRESSVAPPNPEETHNVSSEPLPRTVKFLPNASIVLIGIRGVGKSSLGFLAATAYSRRLVESDRAFFEATGSSTTAYRKTQGAPEFHRRHAEVLKTVLRVNSENSIIVCNFSDLEAEGAAMLQHYAQTLPIVYVTRDTEGIRSHLRVWSVERISDLVSASESLLRSCSNFEFHNLSGEPLEGRSLMNDTDTRASRSAIGPFLTLKRTEHDFLKMLRNILGDAHRGRSHQSAYPLSQLSVEELEFSSAVVLSANDLVSGKVDLDSMQNGVDVVQLDVDLINQGTKSCFSITSEAFAKLRRATILPIWIKVTKSPCEVETQSALSNITEMFLRLAPEYLSADLSLDPGSLARILASKGRTKVIGHYMVSENCEGWHDEQLFAACDKAQLSGCDLAEIIISSSRFQANFDVQAFRDKVNAMRRQAGPRISAYCIGQTGRTSMCFNNILTPVAAASSSADPADPALGLLTACQRNQALFASFVYEPLDFFIYGASVGFSLSPAMHNAAYRVCGMLHTYRTHSASDMADFARLVQEHQFGGAAVVQPFKTVAIPIVDILSPHAKAIGALNTVIPLRGEIPLDSAPDYAAIFRERNRRGPVKALLGDNTDWIGIRACIRRGLSPANTIRPQSSGLVCGAGGMARAAIYAMISLGVRNVFVCNRTFKHAHDLAEHYNRLIEARDIVELSHENAAFTSVTPLKSLDSAWPSDVRLPTMIVSCIPTQQSDGLPTNFTLPHEWLGSRTGGVVVEVSTQSSCADCIT